MMAHYGFLRLFAVFLIASKVSAAAEHRIFFVSHRRYGETGHENRVLFGKDGKRKIRFPAAKQVNQKQKRS